MSRRGACGFGMMWKNIVCKIVGHHWRITRMNGFCHDSQRLCKRCGDMQELRPLNELSEIGTTLYDATEDQLWKAVDE